MPIAAEAEGSCQYAFDRHHGVPWLVDEPEGEPNFPGHLQHIAHLRACGKPPLLAQNRWPDAEFSDWGMGMRQSCRHDVVVVGAGPTGLTLAGELALAGVDVGIAERRAHRTLAGSRAGGLHSRTIEVFDQRGIAERFLAEGYTAQVGGFGQIRLDISDFPTRHPYGLALWQNHIERLLAGWVDELGVPVHRGCEVTRIVQEPTGVTLALAGDEYIGARYVVGCDGGRSVVRKSAGIDFTGWNPTISYLIAEVELAVEPPEWGVRHDALGVHALSRLDGGAAGPVTSGSGAAGPVTSGSGAARPATSGPGPVRVMVTERELRANGEATLRDLSEGLIAVYGTDYGVRNPTWLSRFTDMARQASRTAPAGSCWPATRPTCTTPSGDRA